MEEYIKSFVDENDLSFNDFFDQHRVNILYKRQVLLNIEYTLEIKIEKIKYKTIFIHCSLYKKQNKEESTEANIIAEKEIINKIWFNNNRYFIFNTINFKY